MLLPVLSNSMPPRRVYNAGVRMKSQINRIYTGRTQRDSNLELDNNQFIRPVADPEHRDIAAQALQPPVSPPTDRYPKSIPAFRTHHCPPFLQHRGVINSPTAFRRPTQIVVTMVVIFPAIRRTVEDLRTAEAPRFVLGRTLQAN